jgi:hypothetical protein
MKPDQLPPALRDLQDKLQQAAQRDSEIERRVAQRVRRGRWRRWLIVAVAALVSAGGVAVAQRVFDRKGADAPRDRVRQNDAPAAERGVITRSARPDPSGGPPWAMRVFTNPEGEECVTVGRLLNGALGTYDRARTFRELPATRVGICEPLSRVGLIAVADRRPDPEPRTVVFGLSRQGRPVRITIAGETRTLQPGAFGSFVDVRVGVFDMAGATASTTVDGRTVTRRLG